MDDSPSPNVSYDYDVVIDRGQVLKRKKKASRKFREALWTYSVVTGGRDSVEVPSLGGRHRTGALPVMKEVQVEAKRPRIEFLILPTTEAVEILANKPHGTNAILHVTG